MENLTTGTEVIRVNDFGTWVGIVQHCYGNLWHSAVVVTNVRNLTTGETYPHDLEFTWMYSDVQLKADMVANPLPFDEQDSMA